jgi:hypothetical protein
LGRRDHTVGGAGQGPGRDRLPRRGPGGLAELGKRRRPLHGSQHRRPVAVHAVGEALGEARVCRVGFAAEVEVHHAPRAGHGVEGGGGIQAGAGCEFCERLADIGDEGVDVDEGLLVDAVGAQVGQLVAFDVAPQAFDGVEVGA